MDTLKIITTLWSIAIPSTILFVLIQLLQYNKEPQKGKRIIQDNIFTLSNIFTFITFFSWISILFLTLSDGLLSGFIFSALMSMLLVGLLNVMLDDNEEVKKRKKSVSKDYINQVKISHLKVINGSQSIITE